MNKETEIQIKYLALRYPVRCSRIEELYNEYIESTGRKDFVGFELTSLREKCGIVARGIYLTPLFDIYNSTTGEKI